MSVRWIAIVGLALFILAVAGGLARADVALFGSYYDNPARAAAQNDAEGVRQIVGGGNGNPNQVDERSRTAMHYAAMNGNLQIIAILIKANAKLKSRQLAERHTVTPRRGAKSDRSGKTAARRGGGC